VSAPLRRRAQLVCACHFFLASAGVGRKAALLDLGEHPGLEQRRNRAPLIAPRAPRSLLWRCRYHKAYEYYKMAQASYWTVEEVDLSQDLRDWERLTAEERHFISYVLAFFAASDGIVLENLAVRFMQGEPG